MFANAPLMINFISFTECPVDVVSGDKVYKFIYPRLQSSDVFRLDFSVKGTRDASIILSEFTNEISYYLAGKIYLRIGLGFFLCWIQNTMSADLH